MTIYFARDRSGSPLADAWLATTDEGLEVLGWLPVIRCGACGALVARADVDLHEHDHESHARAAHPLLTADATPPPPVTPPAAGGGQPPWRDRTGNIPIPDGAPDPEPVVWRIWNSLGGWRTGSPNTPGAVRYVRADEGDVVLPAARAKAFIEWFERVYEEYAEAPDLLADAIREQQGGAS